VLEHHLRPRHAHAELIRGFAEDVKEGVQQHHIGPPGGQSLDHGRRGEKDRDPAQKADQGGIIGFAADVTARDQIGAKHLDGDDRGVLESGQPFYSKQSDHRPGNTAHDHDISEPDAASLASHPEEKYRNDRQNQNHSAWGKRQAGKTDDNRNDDAEHKDGWNGLQARRCDLDRCQALLHVVLRSCL
jgi:hypothetical protein